jgi:fructose-1,6-bisphosphatase/inositol monophosphatase family enzyme
VLRLLSGHDPVWILDPVDGTANFVNGVERFATMVALVRGGETVMGWIHDPLTARTLWAEKGAGALVEGPDNAPSPQCIVQDDRSLPEMTVALHHKAFGPHLGKFKRNLRLGSAAHDYWSLVDGRAEILSYRRLRPWDHAAGVLIHGEAGGYGRLLTGRHYRPLPDQEGLLCAPNAEVWRETAALVA